VLILLATAAISLIAGTVLVSDLGWNSHRRQAFDAAPPVVSPESAEPLFLGPVTQVEGTDTLRGELLAPGHGKGFSSGGYSSESRNVLFLDGQSKAARWLLPDTHHVISRSMEIMSSAGAPESRHPVAEVMLVKANDSNAEADEGKLLRLDPTGRNVKTIADGVRAVNHARLSPEGRVTVLYESRRRYVLATFDLVSLEKRSEDELSVPQLK
jgi:hypothetical protein